jgi:hypothetical protein
MRQAGAAISELPFQIRPGPADLERMSGASMVKIRAKTQVKSPWAIGFALIEPRWHGKNVAMARATTGVAVR